MCRFLLARFPPIKRRRLEVLELIEDGVLERPVIGSVVSLPACERV